MTKFIILNELEVAVEKLKISVTTLQEEVDSGDLLEALKSVDLIKSSIVMIINHLYEDEK